MKQFDLAIFIGRFQPLHNSHIKVMNYAAEQADNLLILIGSSFRPRDIKNPFTYQERRFMIENSFEGSANLIFAPIRDYHYNDNAWLSNVQANINMAAEALKAKLGRDITIALVGHKKDGSSYYLDLFPGLDFIDVENFGNINATDIRANYFEDPVFETFAHKTMSILPNGVMKFMESFRNSTEYQKLADEYNFIVKYKESWKAAPYAVTFVTVDVVYVCSGHVLMIKRKALPGKGLWALPGGFINACEWIEDAAIRELKEETKIPGTKEQLKLLIKDSKVFDKPDRSLRGRTITHAYFIEQNLPNLPKVKGSNETLSSKWIPLSHLRMLEEDIFEDHLAIIEHFIKG